MENRIIRQALLERLAELPGAVVIAPGQVGELDRRPGAVEARLGDERIGQLRDGLAGLREAMEQEVSPE